MPPLTGLHMGLIPDGNRRWCKRNGCDAHAVLARHMETLAKIVAGESVLLERHPELRQLDELSVYVLSIDNLTKRTDAGTYIMVTGMLDVLMSMCIAGAALRACQIVLIGEDCVDDDDDDDDFEGGSDGRSTVLPRSLDEKAEAALKLYPPPQLRLGVTSEELAANEAAECEECEVVHVTVDCDAVENSALVRDELGTACSPNAACLIQAFEAKRVQLRISDAVRRRLPPEWLECVDDVTSTISGEKEKPAVVNVVVRAAEDAPPATRDRMAANNLQVDVSYPTVGGGRASLVPPPTRLVEKLTALARTAAEVHVRVFGVLAEIPSPRLRRLLADVCRLSARPTTACRRLNLAVAYDPVRDMREQLLGPEPLDPGTDRRPIDIMLRTSGEQRSSGFFPLQTLYSEWFYLPQLFPDLTVNDIATTLRTFAARERRWGS